MSSIQVRPATLRDAKAIAQIHTASAQEAYKGLVPDEQLKSMSSVEKRQAYWREAIEYCEPQVQVAIDGEKMKASDIIRKLNALGGANGIGLLDIVENRLVGMKDRGVYETPGGAILYRAHEVLEMITVDKDTAHMKSKLAVDFADLVYNGKWFTPLREALSAFALQTQQYVTGTVKLKLYKGNIITAGVTSPSTLYSEDLVTFEESDYNQNDATGFINLWGLPDTVQALREQGKL